MMDIYRRGAQRNRGTTSIVTDLSFTADSDNWWQNNVQWDATSRQLIIQPRWVLHTDGRTHHNYAITLSLEDISSLIGLLGHAGSQKDAALLREHLADHLPALVKLLACAVGVKPVPLKAKKRGGSARRS
jgi:hypothetical protein